MPINFQLIFFKKVFETKITAIALKGRLSGLPPGNDVWGHEEADPWDDDKHPGGEVVRDDVVGHLSPQGQLEAGHGKVARQGRVVFVVLLQLLNVDRVVEHWTDVLLLGDELVLEYHLCVVVVERTDLEKKSTVFIVARAVQMFSYTSSSTFSILYSYPPITKKGLFVDQCTDIVYWLFADMHRAKQ